jgi:uncharacterized membrane protein YfcA
MVTLLICLGFVLLQVLVLMAAIGCYAHRRRGFYYAALYLPVVVLAVVGGVVGGDDWIAVLVIQALLSLTFNFHISSSKRGDE